MAPFPGWEDDYIVPLPLLEDGALSLLEQTLTLGVDFPFLMIMLSPKLYSVLLRNAFSTLLLIKEHTSLPNKHQSGLLPVERTRLVISSTNPKQLAPSVGWPFKDAVTVPTGGQQLGGLEQGSQSEDCACSQPASTMTAPVAGRAAGLEVCPTL